MLTLRYFWYSTDLRAYSEECMLIGGHCTEKECDAFHNKEKGRMVLFQVYTKNGR
jgi:hypothetical protein